MLLETELTEEEAKKLDPNGKRLNLSTKPLYPSSNGETSNPSFGSTPFMSPFSQQKLFLRTI